MGDIQNAVISAFHSTVGELLDEYVDSGRPVDGAIEPQVQRCEVDPVSDRGAYLDALIDIAGRPLRVTAVYELGDGMWRARHSHISECSHDREVVPGLYHAAVEVSLAAILITDRLGRIEYVNPEFERITGLSKREAIGRSIEILRARSTSESTVRQIRRHFFRSERWQGRVRIRNAGGEAVWHRVLLSPVPSSNGDAIRFVAVMIDISDAVSLEDELRRFATTDPLTGLSNRRRFLDFGSHTVRIAVRSGHPLSILLIDIDRFKSLNDWWGHKTGDEALVRFATVLKDTLRDTDLVARLGGDEFAAVLPGANAENAVRTAKRVQHRLREVAVPVDTGETVTFTVSMGVTSVIGRDIVLDNLTLEADQALYRSKHLGRDMVTHYTNL